MACKRTKLIISSKRGKRSRQSEGLQITHSKAVVANGILKGVSAFLLPAGIGTSRCNLFKTQLSNYGADVHSSYAANKTTHIIVDEAIKVDTVYRLVDVIDSTVVIVTTQWLSECLKQKKLIDTKSYVLEKKCAVLADAPCKRINNSERTVGTHDQETVDRSSDSGVSSSPPPAARRNLRPEDQVHAKDVDSEDSDYVASDGETSHPVKVDLLDDADPPSTSSKNARDFRIKFMCAVPSSLKPANYNKHITDQLEILATTYKNTKDTWRAMTYEKAITALKNHPCEVTESEEARKIPGIGERLADKIQEIIDSGHLRKIDEVCSGERMTALNLFAQIWGAGPTTAQIWVQQGFRTLDDLRSKATLTRQQQIGLKHFHDLLDRMPRDEAGQIKCTVEKAALELQPGLDVTACGSYRRNRPTCGDVDVLITHRDGKSHRGLFHKLIKFLHNTGFLTDDLVSQEESGNQTKYMGVCRLPGPNQKYRRLDIIIIPYSELACSLLYFTGSAHFNRSMRLLARRLGMALSEHSLNTGVVRKVTAKLCDGYPLPTPTEESVFDHLGIPYRPPEERDH